MKYCVLIDAKKDGAEVIAVSDGAEVLDSLYRLINCSCVQLLPDHFNRMPDGYVGLIDEELFGKECIVNRLASWLYGTDFHGQPIMNGAVIMKEVPDDFDFMTQEEAQKVADDLNVRLEDKCSMALLGILDNM